MFVHQCGFVAAEEAPLGMGYIRDGLHCGWVTMTQLLLDMDTLIGTIEFASRNNSFRLDLCYQHNKAIIAFLVTQKSY